MQIITTFIKKTRAGETTSVLVGKYSPDYFGINTYYGYENEAEVEDLFGISRYTLSDYLLSKIGYSIDDLVSISNTDAAAKAFDSAKITDIDGNTVDYSELGEAIIKDDAGHTVCTYEDQLSENCIFDFGDDVLTWQTVDNIDVNTILLLIHNDTIELIQDDLIEHGINETPLKLLIYFDSLKSFDNNELEAFLYDGSFYKDYVNEYDNINDVPDSEDFIKIDNKYYTLY